MSKKMYGSIMGGLLILLLGGTFFDLQISQTLYNPNSLFGKFFYGFGQVPAMLSVSFGFMLLICARNREKKVLSIVCVIVLGIISFVYAILPFSIAGYYLDWGTVGRVVVMVFAVLVFWGMVLGTKKIAAINDRGTLIRNGLVFIIMFYSVTKFCGIVKNIWGRPRFYSLLDDFSRFSPWYRIVGRPADDTFKSFPSGHAADACMIIGIVLLAGLVPKLYEKTKLLYVIAFIWTSCVMLARIIAGAHFLSDVTVGAGITYSAFFIFTKICMNRKRKKQQ